MGASKALIDILEPEEGGDEVRQEWDMRRAHASTLFDDLVAEIGRLENLDRHMNEPEPPEEGGKPVGRALWWAEYVGGLLRAQAALERREP